MSGRTIGGREIFAGGTRKPLRLTPNQLQEAGLVCRGPRFFRARPADRTRCNWGLETGVTFCSFFGAAGPQLCARKWVSWLKNDLDLPPGFQPPL